MTTPAERLIKGQGDRILLDLGFQNVAENTEGLPKFPRDARILYHVTFRAHDLLWNYTIKLFRPLPADSWITSFPFLSSLLSHKGKFLETLAGCEARGAGKNCGVHHPPSYFFFPTKTPSPLHNNVSSLSHLLPILNALPVSAIPQPWVYKDAGQGAFGGRGMRIFPSTDKLVAFLSSNQVKQGVIQQYITSPLLLEGHKTSPALYFLVTHWDPLCWYLFDIETQAIVVSADPYDAPISSQPDSLIGHVTNIDANHKRTTFTKYDDDPTRGTLRAFSWYLRDHLEPIIGRERVDALWQELIDQITRSLLAVQPIYAAKFREVKRSFRFLNHFKYYHLLRVDFQFTQDLTPYVLEINQIPLHDCDAGASFYQKIPRWRCLDYDRYRNAIYRFTGLLDEQYDQKIQALEHLLRSHVNATLQDQINPAMAQFLYHQLAQKTFHLPLTLAYPRIDNYQIMDPLLGDASSWNLEILQIIQELIHSL